MINFYEKIKLASKRKKKNFSFLERKISGKTTNSLANLIRDNKTTIPLMEKVFELLNLDIVDRDELTELRKLKQFLDGFKKP